MDRSNLSEALRGSRRNLRIMRRMKRFGVAATQGERANILGIKRLPANRDFRPLGVILAVVAG